MSTVAVANTDAGLSGKTLDLLESDQTITGLKTFSRGAAAPFAVAVGSLVVANLDADKLDGNSSAAFSIPTVQTTTLTGAQADFAATSARYLLLRCNNASLLTISGFAAGADGDIIDVVAINAQVEFVHQATSTASNRLINVATSGNTPLGAASGWARYVYDATTARWRLVGHDQGAWITPTFSAGDYTSSGAGGITVEAADVTRCRYRLSGRCLEISIKISSATLTAATGAEVRRTLLGGFTSGAGRQDGATYVIDGTGTVELGQWFVNDADTVLRWSRVPSANWTAGINQVAFSLNSVIEVA